MTKQEEHDLLLRLDERTEVIQEALVSLCKKLDRQNGRIDKLESWRDKVLGGAIVWGCVVAIITPIGTALLLRLT